MDWLELVIWVLCGALAGLVASLLVRNSKERRAAFVAAMVVSFALLVTLSEIWLLPYLKGRRLSEQVERTLQQIPAYEEIKKADPDLYQKIVAIFVEAERKGEPQAVAAVRARAVIEEIIKKYLPRASDDAVVDYARVMVRELESLKGEECYALLFPQRRGQVDLGEFLDPKTQEDDLRALAAVIRSATQNPQAPPDEKELKPIQAAFFKELSARRGEELSILRHMDDPKVDKEKACRLIVDVYKEIVGMEKREASLLLRQMLSGQ